MKLFSLFLLILSKAHFRASMKFSSANLFTILHYFLSCSILVTTSSSTSICLCAFRSVDIVKDFKPRGSSSICGSFVYYDRVPVVCVYFFLPSIVSSTSLSSLVSSLYSSALLPSSGSFVTWRVVYAHNTLNTDNNELIGWWGLDNKTCTVRSSEQLFSWSVTFVSYVRSNARFGLSSTCVIK